MAAAARIEFPADQSAAPVQDHPRTDAALYCLWALFWLLMVTIAVQDYLQDGGTRLWEPLLWEGSSALGATFWFVMLRAAGGHYRRYLDQPLRWFAHHLKWLPLVALSFIVAVYAVRHGIYAAAGETYRHEPWAFVAGYETIRLALFVSLWLGIVFGFDAFVEWQGQRRRLLSLQKALAEAQLFQLKAQLRPHFFFNALNTISALMHVDAGRADRLLARLGDLLRASLQAGERDMAPLSEELRLLELYAQIMQERFADRVTLAWQVEPETLNVKVPVLLLQPLLENAFKHGVERSTQPVSIEIVSRCSQGNVLLVVRNSGSLAAAEHGDGVGVRNCRERLNVVYGDAASLHLAQEGQSVEARVTIPWRGCVT